MANLKFTVADGFLTVSGGGRTNDYSSTDYRAKAWRNGDRDGVRVFPITGNEGLPRWSTERYTEYELNIDGVDVTPTSASDFVAQFNAACGINLGYNTQYPQHIISENMALDTSVATQITEYAKAGYLTITARAANTDDIFVGDVNVDNTSYRLAAGSSVFMELDDLSKIYIYADAASQEADVVGAFKY
jgi:hypothetical protein